MKDLKNSQSSSHLKLRESTNQPNKLVNDRGDFVIVHSDTNINVNGNTKRSQSSAAKVIAGWGKK